MMSVTKLSLLGGAPVRNNNFPPYNTIGQEEVDAAIKVMNTGVLSGFVANPGPEFLGGQPTLDLESEFCRKFGVKYAVSVNSATSGLHAALVAAGVGPGDEVIVSPYTMSASATAATMCGGIPIFVDIEPFTFCLDPEQVLKAITDRTKAIMAVNIFGQAADLTKLRNIADEYELILVEDNAQAPGAYYGNKWTGTIGDMGVFSFNRHKTMQCGEGGVILCNEERLATRLRMVRNHGEAVFPEWSDALQELGSEDIIGYNYRLTDLQSAIALPQLLKLEKLNKIRIDLAAYLTEKLQQFDFIKPPLVRDGSTHVYYLYPMIYDPDVLRVSRDQFLQAMQAEGMPLTNYVRPLYRLPLYRKRCGNRGCYRFENFPITEELWKRSMVVTSICRPPLSEEHINEFILSIKKIADSADSLRNLA